VLHLNGAKISGPTVLARKDPAEVRSLLEGHGYEVLEVEGDDLPGMHTRFAAAMDHAYGGSARYRRPRAAATGTAPGRGGR
jgi:xylulose-5-phosphate/fructose-6-phosphate phosphoketolase